MSLIISLVFVAIAFSESTVSFGFCLSSNCLLPGVVRCLQRINSSNLHCKTLPSLFNRSGLPPAFLLEGMMDGDDTNQRKDTKKHQFRERWGSRVWGDSFQRVNRGLARQLTGWSCSAGWKWLSQAGIQVWELTSWWERVETMRSHREHLYFKERRQVEVRISKGHY